MSKTFKTELIRVMRSKMFVVSTILTIFLLLQETPLPTSSEFSFECTNVYVFVISVTLGYICLLAPAICVLPYSTSFYEEYTHAHYYYLCRVKKRDYILSKFFVTAVSGGLTLFIGFAIYSILVSVLFAPIQDISMHYLSFEGTLWEYSYNLLNGYFFLAMQCVIAFFFGMVWSSVALLLSVIFLNRFVTLALPSILYFYGFFFAQSTGLRYLDLANGIAPTLSTRNNFVILLIFEALLLIICFILYYLISSRRLRNA